MCLRGKYTARQAACQSLVTLIAFFFSCLSSKIYIFFFVITCSFRKTQAFCLIFHAITLMVFLRKYTRTADRPGFYSPPQPPTQMSRQTKTECRHQKYHTRNSILSVLCMVMSHRGLNHEQRPRVAVALVLCWCESQFNDPARANRAGSFAVISTLVSSNFLLISSRFPSSPLLYPSFLLPLTLQYK